MIELQESVKKYGILNPLIVRSRKDGTYEIILGNRRKFAAEKIRYRKVTVIIRVLMDDDAVLSNSLSSGTLSNSSCIPLLG